MALRASRDDATCGGHHLVRARESPTCGAVIKLAVGPRDRVVAGGAQRSREICGYVVGYRSAQRLRIIPIRRVTAVAIGICAGQVVIVVDVA